MKSLAFLLATVAVAHAHQGLVEPKDLIRTDIRNTGKPEHFTHKEATFPCKYNDLNEAKSKFPISSKTFKPGDKLTFTWPRNNHKGGFIAVAATQYDKSSSEDAFKDPNAVISLGCAQSNCRGDSQYNALNGDEFCSQQEGGDCTVCDHFVTIPSHLATGDYTLQWRIFSHFDSQGKPNRGLLDYVNCVDLKIVNDSPSPRVCPSAPQCEHFRGVTKFDQKDEETEQPDPFSETGVADVAKQCTGGAAPQKPTPAKTTATTVVGKPTFVPVKGALGLKVDWDFCSADDECENGCCSDEFSDDGQMKCTPGGCKAE
ncbi:hypothetical protein HK104_006961 [Borealophlyctis nickersoniae]|nr:hypothetical protein HK104_006961 [Borealophlyctis nickersoniae]